VLTGERDAARLAPAPVREIPVLDDRDRAELTAAVAGLRESQDQLQRLVARTEMLLHPAVATTAARPHAHRSAAPAGSVARPPSTSPAAGNGLKAGAVRMLQVMVDHHPTRLTRAQLATLAGMKVSGGTLGTYLSALRRGGYLDERDRLLEVTDSGLRAGGGHGSEPSTAEQVRERWRAVLKAGARRMLDELLAQHPAGMSRNELAERVGIEATGGTFGTYLSTLRRNGLLDERDGQLHAADVLFLAPGSQR